MTQTVERSNLYELFKQKAEALAANVYRVKDLQEAGSLLTTLAEESGANKIAAASSPMVDECLKNAKLKTAVHTEDLRKHAEEAHMGLSEVDMAVADIGSLQQDCTDLNKRLVSMLPNVHVALIRSDAIVPTLKDAFNKLDAAKPNVPGYMAFITGPSRTSDIERVLTIGVHGPAELKIIFVDNPGGAVNG
ncbi:lactate utilization protein [Peptococcaceae bacterium 1198_IL3148]